MKIIELKNTVLEVSECNSCPCSNYDGEWNISECNLLSDDFNDKETPICGILKNCPLKDKSDE